MTTNNDLPAAVEKAMRRAYSLGQTYWRQADSEYPSQHKKADETQAKFDVLVAETASMLANHSQPAMPADADILYWDADDTEDCLAQGGEYDAVINAVENAWKPELPFEVTLQRAMRLPDVRIRVTAIPEAGEVEYEREEIHPARRRIEGE